MIMSDDLSGRLEPRADRVAADKAVLSWVMAEPRRERTRLANRRTPSQARRACDPRWRPRRKCAGRGNRCCCRAAGAAAADRLRSGSLLQRAQQRLLRCVPGHVDHNGHGPRTIRHNGRTRRGSRRLLGGMATGAACLRHFWGSPEAGNERQSCTAASGVRAAVRRGRGVSGRFRHMLLARAAADGAQRLSWPSVNALAAVEFMLRTGSASSLVSPRGFGPTVHSFGLRKGSHRQAPLSCRSIPTRARGPPALPTGRCRQRRRWRRRTGGYSGRRGVKQVPEPVSPRYRNRAGKCQAGAGATV